MEIGSPPLTAIEEMLLGLRPHLLISRRLAMSPAQWRYSLCSPFWRVYVNHQEGGSIVWAGGRFVLRPHAIQVVPAAVAFRTRLARPVVHDFLHFDLPDLLPGLTRRYFDRPVDLGGHPALEPLRQRWQEALGGSEDPPLLHHVWARALMDAVVATLLERMPAAERLDCLRWLAAAGGMRPAIQCIERRLADPPSNAELAASCGLSVTHFARRFRAEVGLPPARYGLERRLLGAARLLADGDRRIEDVAEACGFPDRFYFTRVFTARLGTPPAAYRHLHQARVPDSAADRTGLGAS